MAEYSAYAVPAPASVSTYRYALLTTHYSLLTTHSSLLTAYRFSLLPVPCSLLTAHCSLLTAHCALLTAPTAHCPLLTAHCPQPTAHCPLLTAHCCLLDAFCSYLPLRAHCVCYHIQSQRRAAEKLKNEEIVWAQQLELVIQATQRHACQVSRISQAEQEHRKPALRA